MDGGIRGYLKFKSIAAAAHATSEFPEEIEADLEHYYNIDLADLWRDTDRLTWRKLGVLIKFLPSESAYITAVRDSMTKEELDAIPESDNYGPWSRAETLLAAIVDLLNHLQWQNQMINKGKNSPSPKHPDPVRRPGVDKKPGLPIEVMERMQRKRMQRALTIARDRAVTQEE